ncbi:hypothetical protein ABPG75_005495 [Micractinium tetrahymenae]
MASSAGQEPDRLVVAGLRNCGNTCYLNAALQALASCEALLKHLQSALELLSPPANPAAAAAPLPPPPGLALSAALLECLRRLQPSAGGGSDTFAPRFFLVLLRSRLPPGLLEPGEEHDAAEAAGSLLHLVSAELQAAFSRSDAQRRMLGRASLAALLGGGSSSSSSVAGSSAANQNKAAGIPADEPAIQSSTLAAVCNGAAGRQVHGGLADASSVLSHPVCSSGSSEEEGSSEDEAAGAAPGSKPIAVGPAEAAVHAAGGPDPASTQPAPAALGAAVPGPALQPSAGGKAVPAPARTEALPTAAPAAPAAAAPPLPDPVLHAWRQQVVLPLQGSSAGELQCLRCGHRSCVQLAPFWVLPLGIPAAAGRTLLGNVPAVGGAALEGCLAAFFGYEALQGVHCTRCSLRASLEAAGSTATRTSGSSGSRNSSSSSSGISSSSGGSSSGGGSSSSSSSAALLCQLEQALGDRSALVLETEVYRGMLERAGLAWVPRPSPAVRRTVAAALPPVLCLQLRRGFWSEHGHVKITGHISFPLVLALPLHLVPRLGHQQGPGPGSAGAGAAAGAGPATGGGPGSACPVRGSAARAAVPQYLLRAVIVHHGGLAGAGHYTVLRCLDSLAQQAQRAGRAQRWVGASDEEVRPAEVADVLAAEASMLVYERCN